MSTRTKIKIVDDADLRAKIDHLYEQTNQIDLAKWSIKCAKHILTLSDVEEFDNTAIENGFRINELWQTGDATVHEVRQAGFKIHEVARQSKSEMTKTAIRASGQAVSVGHMREHAMVCSDYAIKTIQLAFPDQIYKISQERQWQLNELKQYII
jgi:rRNA maturation endonuclease Nob1